MQKIPTLFIRDVENPRLVSREADLDCRWVLDGEGQATEKFDGTCCKIVDAVLYARHHHKAEKGDPPAGWVHWSGPEQQSGHGWLPVDGGPSYRWHSEAPVPHLSGTYELVGPKVQRNPYGLEEHELWLHGCVALCIDRDDWHYEGIEDFLKTNDPIEGIVWHHEDGRMAKIKRRDFGLPWPA